MGQDGSVFTGSNELDVFDGYQWSRIDVPGVLGFRSLAMEKSEGSAQRSPDRVWVGAIDSVGYVERRGDGAWHWVSLQEQLASAGILRPGDVWSVYSVGSGAVWVTDDRVLRWNGTKFESWELKASPRLVGFSDREGALIYQRDVGLLRVGREGPPRLVVADAELPGKGVTWIEKRCRRRADSGPLDRAGLGRKRTYGEMMEHLSTWMSCPLRSKGPCRQEQAGSGMAGLRWRRSRRESWLQAGMAMGFSSPFFRWRGRQMTNALCGLRSWGPACGLRREMDWQAHRGSRSCGDVCQGCRPRCRVRCRGSWERRAPSASSPRQGASPPWSKAEGRLGRDLRPVLQGEALLRDAVETEEGVFVGFGQVSWISPGGNGMDRALPIARRRLQSNPHRQISIRPIGPRGLMG